MVKVYKGDILKHGDPTTVGGYYLEMPDTVAYSDYQALQAALGEALNEWEALTHDWLEPGQKARQRIAELRKLS